MAAEPPPGMPECRKRRRMFCNFESCLRFHTASVATGPWHRAQKRTFGFRPNLVVAAKLRNPRMRTVAGCELWVRRLRRFRVSAGLSIGCTKTETALKWIR